MRELLVETISDAVRDLAISANTELGPDVVAAFRRALDREPSPTAREILQRLIENADIAQKEQIPICQDTGMAVVFVSLGQDLHIVGGSLGEAINDGIRRGYRDGFLRKSLCHALSRKNTGDNTPAVIHYDVVAGDRCRIVVAPKGFGSENMSRVTMLSPAEGLDGVRQYLLERVKAGAPYACAPVTVGVGIGGTMEHAALIAKKALLRPLGSPNPEPELAALEEDWLEQINRLGIGPQGLGGRTTALGVHISTAPCHIASISLAVNLQCHAARHQEKTL